MKRIFILIRKKKKQGTRKKNGKNYKKNWKNNCLRKKTKKKIRKLLYNMINHQFRELKNNP